MDLMERNYFEEVITKISSLKRAELENRIKNFKESFKLDFTQDYLDELGIDRLRHILLAAEINARHIPKRNNYSKRYK